jgi:phosphoribosylaminoimidazole-succinocarboxamide synthase
VNDTAAMSTAAPYVRASLLHKGKVRELYDLGEHLLIVVTDRISAFDYVLSPPVPDKGIVLNQLSAFWFRRTEHIVPNHVVHTDVEPLVEAGVIAREHADLFRDRIMVARRAQRIDVECVVRGYITGGGWRQYAQSGAVNGITLPRGLRKNDRLPEPLFTPAAKNDVGHDEDITFEEMERRIGGELAGRVRELSLRLYEFGRAFCEEKGILLADCKFEFGLLDGGLILIDELFTPDSSRFWAKENYALDIDIDSMDKEPVRTYLANSGWDRESEPDPLPEDIVRATAARYRDIFRRLTGQ